MDRARPWIAVWVVLAAAIAGGSIVLAGGDDAPEEVLRRIRTFLEGHPSARFELTASPASPIVGDGASGEVAGARTRVRSTSAQGVAETIYDGDTHYFRFTFNGEEPERWVRSTPGDRALRRPADGATVAVTVAVSFSVPDTRSPADLVASFERVGAWSSVGPGRIGTTATTRQLLAPDELAMLEALAERVESGNVEATLESLHTITLDYGPGGRLDAITDEVRGRRSTTRFSDWGADIRIDLPPDDEVDSFAERRAEAQAGVRPTA